MLCQNNSSTGIVNLVSYTASSVYNGVTGGLFYNSSFAGASALYITNGSTYNSVKSFIIDHPTNKDKYLVHGCLEGPESGVYYRGKGEINNNTSTIVYLPDYVKDFADDLTIQITPIYNGLKNKEALSVSEIENNRFTVYGSNGKFYWIVYGKRSSIEVEPLKKDVHVKGDGPYKYI